MIGNFQGGSLDAELGIFRTWCFSAGMGGWFVKGGTPPVIKVNAESGDLPVVGQAY